MAGSKGFRQPLTLLATLVLAACADGAPLATSAESRQPELAILPANASFNAALAELRRVTARYHDVAAAVADGFAPVAECEDREGEGRVGIPYANFARLLDGTIDPSKPDALLYEPEKNGRLDLIAVELAIPYALWNGQQAPTFLGAPFQAEDEFGVFGLHVWVWRDNPNGMFAIANPNVSCANAT